MRYALGKKIASLLKDSGLTQADIAKMLGIERASVNTWIQGRHIPSSANIEKLSAIFGIEVNWFRDEEAPYPPPGYCRISRGALLLRSGGGRMDRESPEEEEASGPAAAEKGPPGTHPIEIINENLFRVNHPRLRTLFHQLEEALRTKDQGKVSGLCSRLNRLLRSEAGGKSIKFYSMNGKKGKRDAEEAE